MATPLMKTPFLCTHQHLAYPEGEAGPDGSFSPELLWASVGGSDLMQITAGAEISNSHAERGLQQEPVPHCAGTEAVWNFHEREIALIEGP